MLRLLPVKTDAALLLIRTGLAVIFLYHGIPKILDYSGTILNFEAMGIPGAKVAATIATIIEAPAGLAMLLGVGVEIAGAGSALVMVSAILTFHLPNGGDGVANGFEYQVVLTGAAVAIALSVPGAYALGAKRSIS